MARRHPRGSRRLARHGRAARALASVALTLGLLSASSGAQAAGTEDRLTRLGLGRAELEHLREGHVVVLLLPQPEDYSVFLVGVARVQARPETLLAAFRSLDVLRWHGRTLQYGRFSDTPAVEDLGPLTFNAGDLGDLRRCRVGNCDIRVSSRTMAATQGLDWSAPDAARSASLLLKRALLDELRAYRERGAAGMSVYHESASPDEAGRQLRALLEAPPPPFPESLSHLRYLLEYPLHGLPQTTDVFFWCKEMLRKPIVSVVHMALEAPADGDSPCRVSLSHVYDSHYFLARAEFFSLLPSHEPGGGFYLVRSVRARIDPPHWLRGLLLGRIKREMKSTLRADLEETRRRLEAASGPDSGRQPAGDGRPPSGETAVAILDAAR